MAEEKQKFKTGDLVQLKSGGPIMTVQTYASGDYLNCQWFSGTKLADGTFKEDSIQIASEDSKKKK